MVDPVTDQQPISNTELSKELNFCSHCTAARAAGTKAAGTTSAGEKPPTQ